MVELSYVTVLSSNNSRRYVKPEYSQVAALNTVLPTKVLPSRSTNCLLSCYCTNVRYGRDDIADLANEIDATVIYVQELGKLIQDNNKTWGWNENGLKIARKCCTDCGTVLNSFRRTLSEPRAVISTSEVVKRDEINSGLFNRLRRG